jgi:hypothetical protein
MTNPLESKNEDEIDEIFICDPNIYLETDKNGDTIMPEQAKRQIQELIAKARIDLLDSLIEEEVSLYEIYNNDDKICVGIKIMADGIREKYDE